MSYLDLYKNTTKSSIAINAGLYGTSAIMGAVNSFQRPRSIPRPDFKYQTVNAPTLQPSLRPFKEEVRNIQQESAGARRLAGELGKPEIIPSIYATSVSALNKVATAESAHLTDIKNRNSVAIANAKNQQSAANTQIYNQGTLAQIDQQMKENALVTQSNALSLQGAQTSLAQFANSMNQRNQGVLDLLALEQMLNAYNKE